MGEEALHFSCWKLQYYVEDKVIVTNNRRVSWLLDEHIGIAYSKDLSLEEGLRPLFMFLNDGNWASNACIISIGAEVNQQISSTPKTHIGISSEACILHASFLLMVLLLLLHC